MTRQPHVVAVPYPSQGHVKPLLNLCYKIAAQGIKVTFVNTEFIHAKIMASTPEKGTEGNGITLASVPDGIEHEVDRKDPVKVRASIRRVMPGYLTALVEKMNHSNKDEAVTCLIADVTIGWILEVAENVGAEPVSFCPFGPAALVLSSNVPKLINAGVMDSNGTITNNQQMSLAKDIPPWRNSDLSWSFPGDLKIQKIFFEWSLAIVEETEHVDWLLCNTFYELDSSNCNLNPKILPVGPLLTSHEARNPGSFWQEDASCLIWLDRQKTNSVIYVAFGSSGVFSQHQFNELALALEVAGQPFLWVVRPDLANGSPAVFPNGFLERVADHGKIVEWAPQEKVLAHSSIACFLSHCGWNSTMEGLSLGVPFLCWPCSVDQFRNATYISDVWKVGLKLNPDENGIRSSEEIRRKIEMLLLDGCIKANVSKLKDLGEKSMSIGGSSYENLEKFINHLKH